MPGCSSQMWRCQKSWKNWEASLKAQVMSMIADVGYYITTQILTTSTLKFSSIHAWNYRGNLLTIWLSGTVIGQYDRAVIIHCSCHGCFVELTFEHLSSAQEWLIVSCSHPPWCPMSPRIRPLMHQTCADTTPPLAHRIIPISHFTKRLTRQLTLPALNTASLNSCLWW